MRFDRLALVLKLLRDAEPPRLLLVGTVSGLAIQSFLLILVALPAGSLIDGLDKRNFTAVTFSLVAIVLIGASREFAQLATTLVSTLMTRRIALKIGQQCFAALQQRPYNPVKWIEPGEVMSRTTSDVEVLASSLTTLLAPALQAVFALAFAVFLMVSANWRLTLAAIAFVPLWYWLLQSNGSDVAELRPKVLRATDHLKLIVLERLSSIGVFRAKSFQTEVFDREAYNSAANAYSSTTIGIASRLGRSWLLLGLSGTVLGEMIALIVGAVLVWHGGATPGMLVSFLLIQSQLYGPLNMVASFHVGLETNDAIYQRIADTLTVTELPTVPYRRDFSTLRVDVRALHVAFGDHTLVTDASFSLGQHEWLGFIGDSGSGKSTIALCMAGFQNNALAAGEIRIGDIPVTAWDPIALRRAVILVPQFDSLFSGSIRDNLCCGESFDDVALWDALDLVELRARVERFPAGLNEDIGESAGRISGGERQRLAMARALLRAPRVLILDEAMSGVDAGTERRILDRMRSRRDLALFMISHREGAFRAFDGVVELRNKRLTLLAPSAR